MSPSISLQESKSFASPVILVSNENHHLAGYFVPGFSDKCAADAAARAALTPAVQLALSRPHAIYDHASGFFLPTCVMDGADTMYLVFDSQQTFVGALPACPEGSACDSERFYCIDGIYNPRTDPHYLYDNPMEEPESSGLLPDLLDNHNLHEIARAFRDRLHITRALKTLQHSPRETCRVSAVASISPASNSHWFDSLGDTAQHRVRNGLTHALLDNSFPGVRESSAHALDHYLLRHRLGTTCALSHAIITDSNAGVLGASFETLQHGLEDARGQDPHWQEYYLATSALIAGALDKERPDDPLAAQRKELLRRLPLSNYCNPARHLS